MKRTLLIGTILSLMAITVHADIFGFSMAEPPPPDSYLESIAGQMIMETDVPPEVPGYSNIEFRNQGPSFSTITEIYFGSFLTDLNLDIVGVNSCSPGVSYDVNNKLAPPNPPGSPDATWWYITLDGIDPENPIENGIDINECLNLLVSYDSSMTFTELIADDYVQVAIRVQRLTDPPGSATFVNIARPIPEPASLMLIGSAGALIGFVRRRFVA